MGNSKHTPGPWHPIQYGGFWDIQTEPFYGETSVLNEDHSPNAEANAKLSAAAPELLEALEKVRRHGLIEKDGYDTIVKRVNQAIAKATE